MLERLVIETGIEDSLQRFWEFELSVYVAQAEAAWKAINGGNVDAITKETRAKIMRLERSAKKQSVAALELEVSALIQQDMNDQMALYQRAYKAGIVRTAPVIPAAITAANENTMASLSDFVKSTIDRIASYAGRNVATVIDMAIEDKLAGETTGRIAKAASALIREEGLKIKLPSGRNVRDAYAYVRQNITSAMVYNSAMQQKELFDSIDAPEGKKGVETSSHWGARPEHAEWQGKVYESWEKFVEATGFGEITGICGINCRHTFYAFIFGLSEQVFFPKPKEENDRRYQAQQKRKRMESQVRLLVAEDEVLKAMNQPQQNKAKIKALRSRVRAHTELQESMARDYATAA